MTKRQLLKQERKRLVELKDDWTAVHSEYIRLHGIYRDDPECVILFKCYSMIGKEIVELKERIRMIEKIPHYTENV